MKTTRRRLIEYLGVKKVASARELARGLKLTAADARHHLTSLEDEGVVQVVERRSQGRGRPIQLYGLTREINRHNLDKLADAVLSVCIDGLPDEHKTEALEQIALHIAEGYQTQDGNFTQQLTRAVRHLNTLNYQARWEAHLSAPRILISHCPYTSVLSQHSEDICKIDESLICRLLGRSVSRLPNQNKDEQSEVYCIFRIAKEKEVK